jgi:hypothetical protein
MKLIGPLSFLLAGCWLVAAPSLALSGEADVVAVKATPQAGGIWRFDVTVRHADAGWDHFADKWDIVATDGTVLGTRTLLHPHETEQPFTRSLDGVAIPAEVATVTVRAHDSVHGYGGAEITVQLAD